ncbi:hypothetical protein Q5H92_08145 [Hymenobacter sp. M29]|uniref:Outer membrane protein beta-barrel domain-containing protein n=1 Tax=Hymenobacter mellowenesis TaxID=3063995 RepID=A0ABT9AC67_9BACT|nr:hypothetical protein [Hymenobacter sp. M29]MDO7846322.1 hypothetical protein [Hymenobacter sp. M29]
MPRRLLFLLLGLSAYSYQTQAQTFEPGYVVRAVGDTLRGEIENGFWEAPPLSIRFRRTADSQSETYLPHQLRAARFTGGRYFRFLRLPIDHAAKAIVGHLPRENRPAIQTDSLLAEVLVEGTASLVRVVLPDIIHYVVLRPDRPPLDLSERKYLRQGTDGVWTLVNGNNYRGQLGVYFGDCPTVSQAAQKAAFTVEGLSAVVLAYNTACSPTHQPGHNVLAEAKPRRRLAFQGGVLAGARYNRTESNAAELAGTCVDCAVHPFGGLYAEVLQPSRTAAIFGELTLSSFKSSNAEYDYYSYSKSVYTYKALLGSARLGVRFFIPTPHERQWLVSFGYELNKTIAPRITAVSGATVEATSSNVPFAKAVILPNIGLGFRSKRFTTSVDVQLYRDYNDDSQGYGTAFFGSNFALRAGLGYRLGRNTDEATKRPADSPWSNP